MSESKVGRTVRLEQSVNDRLLALCDHLGVNVNAYLVGEIGKAISRDEVSYRVSNHTLDSQKMLSEFLNAIGQESKQ